MTRVLVFYRENGDVFFASTEGVEVVCVDSNITGPERVYVTHGTFTIDELDSLIDRAIAGEDIGMLGGGGL